MDASIPIAFPGIGEIAGTTPVVVIGPNGAGKSRLMRSSTPAGRFVSAQRRTYLNDRLPYYQAQQAQQEFSSQLSQAHSTPWQFSDEIDTLFAKVLQEHYTALYKNNESAKKGGQQKAYVDDTAIERLEKFWEGVFRFRALSFEDFSPRATRTDAGATPYPARSMSDGERACLYLAARVLSAEPGLLVIDEPELHLHKKLAVDYWNKLEEMRNDVRFVYVTHDLHFALSRRDPTILIVRNEASVERATIASISNDLAETLLGAATLSINARRIVFFEGVSGQGLAHDLFKRWIVSPDAVAIGVGNRDSVISAASAFARVGIVSNAEVIGLVDRDHGPATLLAALAPPIAVLDLHEIESVFALPEVIRAVAKHIGFSKGDPWPLFHAQACTVLGQGLSKAVAQRVRARFDVLLEDKFNSGQIGSTVSDTKESHANALAGFDWQANVRNLFDEEETRIRHAMATPDEQLLIVMSGKAALSSAAATVSLSRETYANVVLDAITDTKHGCHLDITAALGRFLPPR